MWHDVRVFRLRDPVNHQLNYVVVQTDVSGAREAEESLRTLQRNHRNLLHRLLPEQVASTLKADSEYMAATLKQDAGLDLQRSSTASSNGWIT